ncbi:C10 family peptidase [Prevotella communis]|uniref:C10 family peptidase n=1 Tax=Prevotella communis TaxID=2913614 RepID=UPI001EDB029C|nr:C10 family peptidase [Prevotella communis]UKK68881.1 C10 family peptidase [Prevotella communis]UKK71644.1 C10 family peptidase [Prevotella communis]
MKKILLTLFAVFFCWVTIYAQQLTEQEAMERALQYINSNKSSANARRMAAPALKGKKKFTPAKTEARKIYAFNMEGGGYVIASADSRTLPVLGYSTTGTIDWDQMPENMRSWLKQYDETIATLGHRMDFKDGEMRKADGEQVNRRASRSAVEPLIKTHWDQTAPYWDQVPTYQGPDLSLRGKQCYTGCVATAMAQVMNYWQWPNAVPDGLPDYNYVIKYNKQKYTWHLDALSPTTFRWDLMLNDYRVWNEETQQYDQLGTDEQRKAVATLMHYCGQSIKMMYSPDGSGAYTSDVAKALFNYFDYNTPQYISHARFPSIDEWEEIIYSELAAGRPMVYCGASDLGGHSFVCDGYDGNGLFHINWGWAGHDDGYFSLAVLNPYNNTSAGSGSSGIGFCIGEGAVIYTDPHMEQQPLLHHDFGSSYYQITPIRLLKNNIAVFYYTFDKTYNEVADHALGAIDSEGNLHPLFMADPNDSIVYSYMVEDYNYFMVEIDSTMFAPGQGIILHPMLRFRHPGEQWQLIPPTDLSITVGRDKDGRFFMQPNDKEYKLHPTDADITKGTGRLGERSDLTIRVNNNEASDYIGNLYLEPVYLGRINPEEYGTAPVLARGEEMTCGAYIPANGEADVTFSFVPEYGGMVALCVYTDSHYIGELPLTLNNDTLANYFPYLENKSYLSKENGQWYWNVELADRTGVKMPHWIPSPNLRLCVRHFLNDKQVKFDKVTDGLYEYLAALPDNIGTGDYTFTYQMPVEVDQPGDYYYDSYLAEVLNNELVSYCCAKVHRFTIDDPTSIEDVKSEDAAGPVFDLQGRLLSGKPTRRGLYIQGNKKIFVR